MNAFGETMLRATGTLEIELEGGGEAFLDVDLDLSGPQTFARVEHLRYEVLPDQTRFSILVASRDEPSFVLRAPRVPPEPQECTHPAWTHIGSDRYCAACGIDRDEV